jgi:hypothetical protein
MGFTPAAYAAIATAVIAAGTSAYSVESSNAAASANAAYQAQVAKNNQAVANANAQFASQRGEALTNQQQLKTRAAVGAIKAQQAADNIDTDSGSAVDVRSSAEQLGQLDALTVRSNAAREVYGFQTQGVNFSAQAGLLESESDQAVNAGNLGAASSLLGGAASTSGMAAKFQLAGGSGGGATASGGGNTVIGDFGAS